MAMVINTNISSLNAQRQLAGSASKLATSMERLSSGLRINSAKDDAAGLAISSRMTTQITGLNVAQRNANDGISLAQTAEGALSTIGNNLQRIRELAVQSRNATNSDDDRAALQKEVTQLKAEIDRVAETTSFNGTKLLDGSFTSKEFQVGANQGQTIKIDSIVNASIAELGEWNSVKQPAAPVTAALPAGTEASAAVKASAEIDIDEITAGTVTWEINGETISFTADDGTDADANAEAVAAALADNAALKDIFTAEKGANDGSVKIVAKAAGTMLPPTVTGTDDDDATVLTVGVAKGDAEFAAGTFKLNGEEITLKATVGAENRNKDLVAAINASTAATGVTATIADGKLKLESTGNLVIEADGIAAADLKKEIGLEEMSKLATPAGEKKGFNSLDISTVAGADNAILAMDAALKAVNSARADLGAIQNRFESVVSNLATTSENLTASRSRILDTDFAQETANLSSAQVLQQAGTAMVAQANQLPQNVLSLLR